MALDLPLDTRFLLASGNGPGHRGSLFAIDLDGTEAQVEELDAIPSFGLTVVGDRLYRVLSSVGGKDPHSELLVYDKTGVLTYRRLERVADPHGIVQHGNRFAVPCSERNQIVWLDADGHVTERWQAPGEGDTWHVNGVHVRDGRLFASAFGMHATHDDLTANLGKPTGVIFDVATRQVVVSALRCPHDPQFIDGGWFVSNSRAGEILLIDECTGGRTRTLNLGGWTRGVAIDEERMYVGISAERHTDAETGRAEIAVVDRKTWKELARVELPCREVHSVALVPRSFRMALRRGLRTNAVRVSVQDNEDLFRLTGNIHPTQHWTPMPMLEPDECRVTVTAALPRSARAGAVLTTEVAVENASNVVYLTALPHPVAIAYRWDRADGDVRTRVSEGRSPFAKPLAPGDRMTSVVTLACPPDPGRYLLTLSVVQEWVRWFDDVDPVAAVHANVALA